MYLVIYRISNPTVSPEEAITSPAYDTQESIYKDFFKELKEAAAELDESKESYGSADLMYQGDVEKWRKFANSLRLRLALRVRYADAALAAANISDLEESDLIVTKSDNAVACIQLTMWQAIETQTIIDL